MGLGVEVYTVLVLALVCANLPFLNERLFVVGPRRNPKALAWRLLELVLGAAIPLAVGFILEQRAGQIHPQGWQFYAAAGCLFLTLAFPGFVWRYLRRGRPAAQA